MIDATFHHNNGTSESSIDYFVASSSLDLNNLGQFCTLENPLNLSSYDPIKATISVNAKEDKTVSKYSNTYTEFKHEKINWDNSKLHEYQELSAKALTEASSYWDTAETIPLLSSLFSQLLVKCANITFSSTSGYKSNKKEPHNKLSEAEKQVTKKFLLWKQAGKPALKYDPTQAAYTSARSNLQRQRRYQENLKSIKFNNFLM